MFQSLTWAISAIFCLVAFYEPRGNVSLKNKHYMDQVVHLIGQLFFKNDQEDYFNGQSVIPNVFAFFSWLYLIFDLTWLVLSWLVMFQKKGNLRLVSQIWSANTALVCLIDLILVIMLGADYHKCLSKNNISTEAICANGILPVLIVAGKGFVLWIINAIFAVVVWKISKQLQQKTPLNHFMPRFTLQGSPNMGPPFQQQYLEGYQYNNGSPVPARFSQSPYSPQAPTTPYSPAVPTTPFADTVPRSPVRQSWSQYTPQVPTQQAYRQYQQQQYELPRRY